MRVAYNDIEKRFVFDFEHNGTEKEEFIRKAVDTAHKQINLYHYDLILFPRKRSRECQYMSCYIYRFNQPRLYSFEEVLAKPIGNEVSSLISQKNVLVLDDEISSDISLKEILNTIKALNKGKEITIFSLTGFKDVISESHTDKITK